MSSLMLQLGATGGGVQKTYIEDVFGTYLYTGNGSAQTINNGIPLADTASWSAAFITVPNAAADTLPLSDPFVDASGNIYLSGVVQDTTTSVWKAVITKQNPDLSLAWAREIATVGSNTIQPSGITADSSGNVYAAFSFAPVYGANDPILIKLDSTGAVVFNKKFNYFSSPAGDGYQTLRNISVDSSGNIFLSGATRIANMPWSTIWKLNSSGGVVWSKIFSSGYQSMKVNNLSFDSSGNAYGMCSFYNADVGGQEIAVFKLNSSGGLTSMVRVITGGSIGDTWGVADSSGNTYITFRDASDRISLVKLNSSLGIVWQKQIGSRGPEYEAYGNPCVDSAGNVYVHTAGGYVMKYDSSGNRVWSRFIDKVYLRGIAATPDGNVLAVGYYPPTSTTVNFIQVKLKQDGTTTGGNASYVSVYSKTNPPTNMAYATGSFSQANTTISSTLSDSTTYTVTTGAQTVSVYTQSEITGAAGMVWLKRRSAVGSHRLIDTVRGSSKTIYTDTNEAQGTDATVLTDFNANGFSVGNSVMNTSAVTLASWTFRKAPKFFDVVTGTGTGTFSHSLGMVPGMIIVKPTNTASDWMVWHNTFSNPTNDFMRLNGTGAKVTYGTALWGVTSTSFSIVSPDLIGGGGNSWVAYIFAHDTSTDGLIQCGSFYANMYGVFSVDLGWEPQFLLVKQTDAVGNWWVYDTARRLISADVATDLKPNTSGAETSTQWVSINQTGFTLTNYNASSGFIYMAIRRGPMRTPTDPAKVFAPVARSGTGVNAEVTCGFAPDTVIEGNRASGSAGTKFGVWDRLRYNGYLLTTTTDFEAGGGATVVQANPFDSMTGFKVGTTSTLTNAASNTFANFLFKRAPGFFDVVCYTGTGVARTIKHNLGVAPELYLIKSRSDYGNWMVSGASSAFPSQTNSYMVLNSPNSLRSVANGFQTPTSTTIGIGTGLQASADVNFGDRWYVAYLFASCPGVSKVGTYTGNGSSQTINCGFTNGARFILIKCTSADGDWFVWDTARGIVAGNDPHLSLNNTGGEATTYDSIDPDASGFSVNQVAATNVNVNATTYIYLAIA